MPSLIAKRYAQALFNLADETGELTAVNDDARIVSTAISESPELNGFLRNPVLSAAVKKTVITQLFEKKIHKVTLNFILFLTEKSRLAFLGEILEAFEKLFDLSQGIIRAKLTSRFSLEGHDLESIKKRLSEKFNKKIEPELVIDESIIGGFKLQINDDVFDLSVKTELDNFYKRALHEQKV